MEFSFKENSTSESAAARDGSPQEKSILRLEPIRGEMLTVVYYDDRWYSGIVTVNVNYTLSAVAFCNLSE